MTFELIVSQGRIADRTSGAIRGAALTAQALARLTGLSPAFIGAPSPARQDDWRQSLPEAGETLQALQKAVISVLERGHKPLMVANTCSASLATLPLVARRHPDAVFLWIDAHGDFNTPETTQSGYLGGMVLAAACGLWRSGHGDGLNPAQVVIAGARDMDPAEAALLARAGVRLLSPSETTPAAILAAIGDAPVWVHVDWDALEPNHVPAAYAIADGLQPQAMKAIFAALPKERIAGIELAEFEASGDPALDARALDTILDITAPLFSQ